LDLDLIESADPDPGEGNAGPQRKNSYALKSRLSYMYLEDDPDGSLAGTFLNQIFFFN
jgi:hypothetical protein